MRGRRRRRPGVGLDAAPSGGPFAQRRSSRSASLRSRAILGVEPAAVEGQADRLAEPGDGLGLDPLLAGELVLGRGLDAGEADLGLGQRDGVLGLRAGGLGVVAAGLGLDRPQGGQRGVGELGQAVEDVADPADGGPPGLSRASRNAATQALASRPSSALVDERLDRVRVAVLERLHVRRDQPGVDRVGAVAGQVDPPLVGGVGDPGPHRFELAAGPLPRRLVAGVAWPSRGRPAGGRASARAGRR